MIDAVIEGDCLDVLLTLPASSVQCCITSPPYWGLKDYGVAPRRWGDGWEGVLGHEPTLDLFVAHLVEIFGAVARVLRPDGLLWLNLGDSFVHGAVTGLSRNWLSSKAVDNKQIAPLAARAKWSGLAKGNLMGMPWRVAFAMQRAGWILRSDVIWAKTNCYPEGRHVRRPAKSHEHLFMFAHPKSKGRYFYQTETDDESRIRDVQSVGSGGGYKGHPAVMPEALIDPFVRNSSRMWDLILDPFAGTGTTGVVAHRNHRRFVGIELSSANVEVANQRLYDAYPLWSLILKARTVRRAPPPPPPPRLVAK